VKTLVNSAFAERVLLDWAKNNEILELFLVVMHPWNPLFGRDDLKI
jgi:hypothetical protein